MKKTLLALFLLITLSSQAQEPALIPQPVSLEKRGSSFELNKFTQIEVSEKNPDLVRMARFLSQHLLTKTGFQIRVILAGEPKDNKGTTISLSLNRKEDAAIGEEGYTLEASGSYSIIRANKPAGLFYGIQTFLQLFPKDIESVEMVKKDYWTCPGVRITDYPRFGWRGLMLDVSRHFFTKEEVKRFIDDMVKYKYNVLHWHLTDDQGWRIEIKSLPKLTSVGAWRVPRVGRVSYVTPPKPDEPRTYGGFYTQDDIKEIVQYAKDRFVNVLPEIDVPGHSLAMVAAYPELNGTPGTYQVNSLEKFMNWHSGGFDALVDNTLNPANDTVYQYLDKIFGEVAQLFPFEYIHMGGDECAKNFWAQNASIKKLMEKENLKDLHEVQSYFVKRLGGIIQKHGKKMIGWDEILEGGLAEGAAVMSWRGDKGGIEAAKLKHPVVMTPNQFVYLDFNQGEAWLEPPIYANLRMKKTYQFEPVPDGVDPKFILGGQGNLWTEQVPGLRSAQYMVWPRAFAIAEKLWSPKNAKDYNQFVKRVEVHFERLDAAQTKHANTIYDPIIVAKKGENDKVMIELSSEIEGLDIYYSFDETHPDNFYPKYTAPVAIPLDAINLKVVAYRSGKPVSRQIDIPVTELKRRAGVK
ncbi:MULTISPECIES: beta-N-acetylhexosaminidase [unclassified Paraflavitalea]|uniref:beta-N-acetylhexosaminidase n=1 Tax=unclassified Paraflavitalea TaxID=2798305 RepID=UPI003D34BFFD